MAGNGILSILKIVVGIISGSVAVVADGIDSATDVVTSLITLITTRIISRPPDIKYAYGYEKADTVAAKILSFVVFFAGAQLAYNTIFRFITGAVIGMPKMVAIWVTILSIAGKFLLSRYTFKVGRKYDSAMLMANAQNMRNDILISASVLLGLVFTFLFKRPVLDMLTALLVSFYIMRTAWGIFMKSSRELMDGVSDPKVYEQVFKAVHRVPGANNPHRARIRQMGKMFLIAIDVEVNPEISVREGHEIARRVEQEIKKSLVHVYDILIHIEPEGEHEDEVFGINEGSLK